MTETEGEVGIEVFNFHTILTPNKYHRNKVSGGLRLSFCNKKASAPRDFAFHTKPPTVPASNKIVICRIFLYSATQ